MEKYNQSDIYFEIIDGAAARQGEYFRNYWSAGTQQHNNL